MDKDFNRTYADDLACRWAAVYLEVPQVDRLTISYIAAGPDLSDITLGEPSYLRIHALVLGEIRPIYAEFTDIIDGMVDLAAEERATEASSGP